MVSFTEMYRVGEVMGIACTLCLSCLGGRGGGLKVPSVVMSVWNLMELVVGY